MRAQRGEKGKRERDTENERKINRSNNKKRERKRAIVDFFSMIKELLATKNLNLLYF